MKTIRHEFESRLLPRLLAATRCGFTFYDANRLNSILEFTPNDPTTASTLVQFVVISVIRVSVLPSYET
jgi:hypothetical protein